MKLHFITISREFMGWVNDPEWLTHTACASAIEEVANWSSSNI